MAFLTDRKRAVGMGAAHSGAHHMWGMTVSSVALLILVPLFLLIARANGWAIAGYIVLLVVLYPLITRPVTFALCRKDFSRVRSQLYPAEAGKQQ